ncbi:hypothetical protein AVEN_234040-1 [Araneus ventricosus]|uniref:Uncharacterized protein n=1 Tax=Araneus ventricosus TaxID=182803 RepID=A0A4Y2FKC3_ARAVE|nr:hypothetical protein AVEN_234040-1 [Araneus ventricosus]
MCYSIDGGVVFPVGPAQLTASHQYPHFWRVVSAVRCMMDSSRSAQRAVTQFLRAEGMHASQIYRRMEDVYGEQCLARCTIFRCLQRYEAGRVNIKDLPRPGPAHVLPTVPRFRMWMSSYSKGTVHHIIHKKLGYGKVCAQLVPKHLTENQKTARMGVCLTQQFLH